MNSKALIYSILICLAGMVLFMPFLGSVHLFDWDEINFAECAREMIVTGDYFSVKINYQPFWEKPPIFIWMQAFSMKLFGINEFSARFPNAVCGIITLVVLFNIGRKLVDEKFGLLWVLVYAGSFLPHFYFKSGIIDPWFNLFIFLSIYYIILFTNQSITGLKLLIYSAILLGLATLTKGPAAILIVGLCVLMFWVLNRFSKIITLKQIIVYVIAVASVGGLWFVMLIVTGNSAIIEEFFIYQIRLFNTQDAGHGGPFYYHWLVLLIGCFPLSVFSLRSFKKNNFDTPFQKHFKMWMLILFWVVLILFSIVKTKIVHYSSLCYFPLSYLGVYVIYKLINGELKWKKVTSILLLFFSILIGSAIALLPFVDKNKEIIIRKELIKDLFAIENLKANVTWLGFEWLIGIILIGGVLAMFFLIKKQKIKQAIICVFFCSLVTVNLSSLIIAPRIEQYSQNAAIEFYEYLQNKDCYIETLGYKSYAHLFYSQKKEQKNEKSYDKEWLLHGEIDKVAYFVSKITELNNIKNDYPQLMEIYRKNGFVFWKRNN